MRLIVASQINELLLRARKLKTYDTKNAIAKKYQIYELQQIETL